MVGRHLRVLVVAAAVAVAAGLLIHSAGQSAAPAQFVTWSTATSAAPDATAEPVVSLIPDPSSTPPPDGGLLGGLQEPLGTMLNGLNAETRSVAAGQYALLQEIGDALREHISQFLQWVTSRH